MFDELRKLQPIADSRGHGQSWKNLCEIQTRKSADTAEFEAWQAGGNLDTLAYIAAVAGYAIKTGDTRYADAVRHDVNALIAE